MKKLIGKIIKKVLGSLLSALVTPKMIIWGLKHAAKQSKTMIDDHGVGIIEAGYAGDIEAVQEHAKKLLETLTKKK